MEEDINVKESDEDSRECVSLTDSPYVGGNKMSSSLKDRLKRSRMHSSPLSRPCSSSFAAPVAPRLIKFADSISIKKDSLLSARQAIQNAMNGPYKEEAETAVKISDPVISENYFKEPDTVVITQTCQDTDLKITENSSKKHNPVISYPYHEVIKHETIAEMPENTLDEPCIEINENSSSNSKHSFKSDTEKPDTNVINNFCSFSKDDIENTSDIEILQTMYSNLKKQSCENEETLRKLKLVQQHHSKNDPNTLTNITAKWLTCAQWSLKRLYDMMPVPESVSFSDFLTLCQVDFDLVKYDSENDVFL